MYTDGSHSQENKTSGYGIRIVLHQYGSERVIHRVSEGFGSTPINEAEFTALHEALRWLLNNCEAAIRIFTNNKYTLNSSTSSELRRTNFYLTQEIHNFAERLPNENQTPFAVIHYILSHTELTSQGKKYTGNFYADRLATEGRLKPGADDETKYL